MDGVVVVVGAVGARAEQRHRQVEEAPVRRRVRHVRAEVDGRGVDLRVGGHVGYRGQEVVHHAGVVRVVDGGAVEPGLQDVGEEERPARRICGEGAGVSGLSFFFFCCR